jgi:hypothetical protein
MENVAPSQTRPPLNSSQPVGLPPRYLFLSIGLNVALLIFLAVAFRQHVATLSIDSSDKKPEPNRVSSKLHPAQPWRQLESTDLAVYAANLRAVGCPPKTVRDILLPMLQDKFARPKTPVAELTNFWACFSQRQAVAAALAKQNADLREQKDKAVADLLDYSWTTEGIKQAYSGDAAYALGFLDYDRAEKLLCIADRFQTQFAQKSHRVDRSAIYEAWRREVGEILSASEFEEFELRGLLMIFQRHNPTLCNAGLTGSELRQLMTFRRELCQPLPSVLLAGGEELVHEPTWSGEQQFNAKARSLLGESRFLDYLKNCDVSIDRTVAALDNQQLPRSLALQLFDLRQNAIARAQQIRDLNIHRSEKRVQLGALRQNAFETVLTLCNGAAESPLMRANEKWLQEIKTP